jgi:penicillin amidase
VPGGSTDRERLRRLGRGEPIAAICQDEGWSRSDFDAWWRSELDHRATSDAAPGSDAAPESDDAPASRNLDAPAEIIRDGRGIPHVYAGSDHDLFLAWGFAMAQDRLFQLELQRRKGHGTVAALLGVAGLEFDRPAHLIGFPALAQAELDRLDPETRSLLDAFASGVSVAVERMRGTLPIEFDLLGATPDAWTALDLLACVTAWRWQFTGRPHVIAGPELLKRHLGDARLVDALLRAGREADTPILPPDARYPVTSGAPVAVPPGAQSVAGDPIGSNNWVVGGSRSRSGAPLLASDPHMPYVSYSAFHEVGLHGGSFDAVGAALVGMPGLLFGRNRQLAWGITNNICSLRDLYQERPVSLPGNGSRPAFEYDGAAEAAAVREVSIEVRDAEDVSLTVVATRNGPLVDDLLPPLARDTGPVSMRWLGTEPCDWPGALIRLMRSQSAAEGATAVDGWLVPTYNLLLADASGSIAYRATGQIPLRSVPDRGYRPGWDPVHQWTGLIPAEGMPRAIDPARGWLATANNRPAPDDYPFPLSGTWDEALRARRIGDLIEERTPLDRETLSSMHADVRASRADNTLPAMLALFEGVADEPANAVLQILGAWHREATPDSAGAAIFEVLFWRWCQTVLVERLGDRSLADYLAPWSAGLASALLHGDNVGWFAPGRRELVAGDVLRQTIEELTERLGPDPKAWRWGSLHMLRLRHPMSGRGDLGELLDKPMVEVGGDLTTLNNSGFDANRDPRGPQGPRAWEATSGAGYRLEVDMGESPPVAWTITAESQSGDPGSRHWDDQRADFLAGRVRRLPLDRTEVEAGAQTRTQLVPADAAQGGRA